jgi:hypothetical protein
VPKFTKTAMNIGKDSLNILNTVKLTLIVKITNSSINPYSPLVNTNTKILVMYHFVLKVSD